MTTADVQTTQPVESGGTAPAVELRNVTAGYGRAAVLEDVSFCVEPNSVTAVLGANGAGKTTLLRVIGGSIIARTGSVHLHGTDVSKATTWRRSRAGLASVPEGRGIFRTLTVQDNLRLSVPRLRQNEAVSVALDIFPALQSRLSNTAGQLSGGQQQMLAVARAFIANPTVVLIDEVSMGLAPQVIDTLFESLHRLRSSGAALIIVEQYVRRALDIADAVVVLSNGRVAHAGSAASVDEDALARTYHGTGPTG